MSTPFRMEAPLRWLWPVGCLVASSLTGFSDTLTILAFHFLNMLSSFLPGLCTNCAFCLECSLSSWGDAFHSPQFQKVLLSPPPFTRSPLLLLFSVMSHDVIILLVNLTPPLHYFIESCLKTGLHLSSPSTVPACLVYVFYTWWS